jgi:hypothetical protein
MMRDNNQLGVGGRVWRDVGEEARGSFSLWGGGIKSFEVTNSARKKNNYTCSPRSNSLSLNIE